MNVRHAILAFILLSLISHAQACWIVDEVDANEARELTIPAEITVETFSLSGASDAKPDMAAVRIRLWLESLRSGRFGQVERVYVSTFTVGEDPTREDVEISVDVPRREEAFEFTMPISDLRRSRLCIDGRDVEKFLPCAGGTFIYRLPEK